MMRQVKDATERKNEILDAAATLFTAKGYDDTSTGDILAKVGIARGTLYYHFKSKEDILDALINRVTAAIVTEVRAALDAEGSALAQISRFIRALKVDTALGQEIKKEAHKPQNALMHRKMEQQLLTKIIPLLAELIRKGISEGVFATAHPEEVAEMMMVYASAVLDEENEMTEEERRRKIAAFIDNCEILLGATPGAFAPLRDDIN